MMRLPPSDAQSRAFRIEAALRFELATLAMLPPSERHEVIRLVQNWLNRWVRADTIADVDTSRGGS